ncbi:hypothetical protein [robinz microvirus RP_65]|nr:hypothetical protein [robinz microvirus RP_65]
MSLDTLVLDDTTNHQKHYKTKKQRGQTPVKKKTKKATKPRSEGSDQAKQSAARRD